MKYNGVLLHISCLPNNCGIGSLGGSAFSFVDFLAASGVDFWQTLPLSMTAYGDSPYQSPSAFAGNPYFIDIDLLIGEGLLHRGEVDVTVGRGIDYGALFTDRYALLKKAFARFAPDDEYFGFVRDNAFWLEDFALFTALKAKFDFKAFIEWPEKFRFKQNLSETDLSELRPEADFHKFLQYFFDKQLRALKTYAEAKGVRLIGDLPIYVAYDSADVWADSGLFLLDKNLRPVEVAGVPPDYFSATGQLWGNPLYDWAAHKKQNFKWWHARLRHQLKYFDKIRIDHFRGFESYYKIPYGLEDATVGKWAKGVGLKVFEGIKKEIDGKIIAEDLGVITQNVRKLVILSGFPSMRVYQFAFDGKPDNEHLPENLARDNIVYYTGTHDNDTLLGWYGGLSEITKAQIRAEAGAADGNITEAVLKTVMSSRADLVIVPMQDYLKEGGEARMNTPSTIGGNWLYRLPADYKKSAPIIKEAVKYRKI